VAVHVIRLILGGVFDRFPKLQIVIGHLGEGLPGMFQRLDIMAPAVTKLKRPVTAYLREDIHYTFSGFSRRLSSPCFCNLAASTA
jgi:predicted TIM-barrel fold metal-dependent hydrolase